MASLSLQEFSEFYKELRNVSSIQEKTSVGKWFLLGRKPCYPLPLKTTTSAFFDSNTSSYIFIAEDLDKRTYKGCITTSDAGRLSVELNGMNIRDSFKLDPSYCVAIQPLTAAEAQKVHEAARVSLTEEEAQKVQEAAKNSFNILTEVWYV